MPAAKKRAAAQPRMMALVLVISMSAPIQLGAVARAAPVTPLNQFAERGLITLPCTGS